MKRNKILYIVEADLMSGSGKCAFELIQLLKSKTDFEPIVITQHYNNLNVECNKLFIENYSVHYARTCSMGMGLLGWLIAFLCRPFLNFWSYQKIKKKINFKSIRLIHTNTSASDFGAFLYRKLRIPHIWHIREFLIFNHIRKPIIYNLPQYISRNSSEIITVSNQLKEFIQNKSNQSNVKTIYDGVCGIYSRNDSTSSSLSDELRIVCVGNLMPMKGQDCLLKAICLLPKRVLSKISVDFYGLNTNDFEQKLKAIVHENSIEHVVSFKGFRSNISEILSNYDIGIQPSLTEGFSRVTIEYMLAGLCVIGNKDTTIQEQIDHKKTGLLYKGDDIQSLADNIIYCFFHRNEIAKFGQQARKVALEKYCIENNFYNIVAEYDSVIKVNIPSK